LTIHDFIGVFEHAVPGEFAVRINQL
jgi:hypothetical protein